MEFQLRSLQCVASVACAFSGETVQKVENLLCSTRKKKGEKRVFVQFVSPADWSVSTKKEKVGIFFSSFLFRQWEVL